MIRDRCCLHQVARSVHDNHLPSRSLSTSHRRSWTTCPGVSATHVCPEPLGADDWSTGVPISVLRSMATTWVDGFFWREVEEQLASFPRYMVEIDGQRIHYPHVRWSRADSTPVLLCHGWPGSYLEFLDLIPLLTEPADEDLRAFDVIVPSTTCPFDEEPDGALGRHRILAHITLYWLTRSAGSAAYTVYAAEGGPWAGPQAKPTQPVGAIMFAQTSAWDRAELEFDIVH